MEGLTERQSYIRWSKSDFVVSTFKEQSLEATGKLTTIEVVELQLRMTPEEFDLTKGGLVALPDPTSEQFAAMKELGETLDGVVLEEETE